MFLTCIQEIEGFTIDRHYKLQGCAGEYVQLINDCGQSIILYESYFKIKGGK